MRLSFIVNDPALIRRWEIRGGVADYNHVKACWCYWNHTRFRHCTGYMFRLDCYGTRECLDLYLARTSRFTTAGQLEGAESYVQISLQNYPQTGDELLTQLLDNWGLPHGEAARQGIWSPVLTSLMDFWEDFLQAVDGFVDHHEIHTDTGDYDW